MNTYQETALAFACEQETLVGVLARPPAAPAHDLGVLIVVGGPQYRAGSHRHFVQLARELATAGYPVLRFDCRGMGDSTGQPLGFERQAADIAAAMDTLQATAPQVRRVVLWGLCDGASAALLYLDERRQDTRVAGLCLLNPWVRSEATESQARVRHYYLERLKERSFWAKLLSGRVGAQALGGLARSLRGAFGRGASSAAGEVLPFAARMARAWQCFPGHTLLVLSGRDLTAREFEIARAGEQRWRTGLKATSLTEHHLPEADHTVSDEPSRKRLDGLCAQWLRECFGPAPAAVLGSGGRL